MLADRNIALLLAAVAGFVDAVGYLTLHHLFTAHMTGNASKLGVALAHGRLGDALPLVLAPVFFVCGIAGGTLLVDRRARRRLFAVQAALIAAYMAYGSTVVHGETGPGHARVGFYVLAALATVALGLQTAALTEIGGTTVRTTYVSGTLTNLTMTAVRRLSGRDTKPHRLRLLFGVWLAYVVFATAGAFTLRELSVWCLAFPTAALLALALASKA
ncbi:MAG TPA: YoaK family protein [Gaiellaceae bacterium]|nr:YoaK family protein [Gaiellaceae bacterium]